MSESMVSEWQKGGLRYQKLKEVIPDFLAPTQVQAFFVAVRSHGGPFRLINPFTPLQREFVIAATPEGVVVLKLRRPGVFRASIAGIVHRASTDEADATWSEGWFVVGGTRYQPIAFHREDAEQVAQLVAQ